MTKNIIIMLHVENVKSEKDQFAEIDLSLCKHSLSGTIFEEKREVPYN